MARAMGKLLGNCQHCGMPIEFVAEAIGTMALCPYCRKQTELMLAAPPQESAIPKRLIVWSIIAALIVILGGIGITIALKRAQRLAKELKPAPAITNQVR